MIVTILEQFNVLPRTKRLVVVVVVALEDPALIITYCSDCKAAFAPSFDAGMPASPLL